MTALPENLWNSPAIRKRFDFEAGFDCDRAPLDQKHYWFIVPEADSRTGTIAVKNFKEDDIINILPHPMQQQFAEELQRFLQKELHYDGLWIVGWTHPPTRTAIVTNQDNTWNRLAVIWLDADGDPQYTVESDFPFHHMVQEGVEYYAAQAVKAHKQWSEAYGHSAMKDDLGLNEGQTKKTALESLRKGH